MILIFLLLDQYSPTTPRTSKIKNNNEIKDYFNNNLKKRDLEKKKIYSNVSALGLNVGIASISLYSIIAWSLQGGIFWSLGLIVFTFLRIVGVCITSTVPADEFDFIKAFLENPKYYCLFSAVEAISSMGYAIVVVVIDPYPPMIYYNLPIVISWWLIAFFGIY